MGQLTIDVPADQKIINVFDANVRGWSVKAADGKQRITADLFEPAKASQQVIVELEKFLPGQAKGELTVPVVSAAGVGRQQGTVAVSVAESLRAEVAKSTGLMQEDAEGHNRPGYRGQLGLRLSLRHRALRVGLERGKGAAADHGRFAGRGPAAARAAHGGRNGGLHDREGGCFHVGLGNTAGLRGF